MNRACLHFSFPGLPEIGCVFTGRCGEGLCGNISKNAGEPPERVAATREKFFGNLPGLLGIAECRQVHGDALIEACAGGEEESQEADGLMSDAAGLGLLIKTADCQPILVASGKGGQVMAVHAGWRGNRLHFPRTAIERFCARYDLDPADLYAARGPSLGPGMARFENFSDEWPQEFAPWFDEKTGCMDLWALTRHQLNAAGIPHSQIYGIDVCTLSNSGNYFSWRAEKTRGRQGALIWRRA